MPNLPFQGIIPPLVTPLADQDLLDVAGLERLIEHVLAGGVQGLFLLGTTGEGPSLSHKVKRELVGQATRIVRGRAPILVGVSDTSPAESLALARDACELGAEAVVLSPPYYFPMSQADLVRYVSEFAEQSPLPVMLYNLPSHTKTAFTLESVRQLIHEAPNVVGIKDSSGQMLYFQQLLVLAQERPGFTVLMGPEELLAPAVLMGGHGGVCGGANLLPALYTDLYEAAVTGDLREVHRLQQQVLRFSSKLYDGGHSPTGYLTGLKTALSFAGLCKARLAEPLFQMSTSRQARLAQHLRDLGVELAPHPV